jgi:glycerol kinase
MQTPVIRPVVTELTAQGAAYLAGLHIGIWKDFSQIKHLWKAERKFSPQMSTDKVYNLKQKWAKAVKCAQMWES